MKKTIAMLLALLMLCCTCALAETAESEQPAPSSVWVLVASVDENQNLTEIKPDEGNLFLIAFYDNSVYVIYSNENYMTGVYQVDDATGDYYLFPLNTETGEMSETPATWCVYMEDVDLLCVPSMEEAGGAVTYLYFAHYQGDLK